VVFFAGFGIGLGSRSTSGLQAALDAAMGDLAGAQGKIADLTGRLTTAQSDGSELGTLADQLRGQVTDLTAQLTARVELPELAGNSRDQIETLAEERGWDLTVKQKESAQSPGTVLSQSPKPGFLMSLGAPLTIMVAKPLPPKMPNLVGKKQKDAEATAQKNGWQLSIKKEVSSQPPGTIIRQTPAPGTFMRGTASLTVVIAKAPPKEQSGGSSPGSNCDPNYGGACLTPGIGDYDCAGGSGNGPNYVYGTVRVIGYDIYDLDRDGDGYGCE